MSFDPCGNPMGSYGAGFGFTGEQTDANGSVFLRVRYYEPSIGVFNALDPFEGKSCTPMTLNGYGYVEGNVTNKTDPSGLISSHDPVAMQSDFSTVMEEVSVVNGNTNLPYGGRTKEPGRARNKFTQLSLYSAIQRGQFSLCSINFAPITYRELLASVIGMEFGNLTGNTYDNAVEALGRYYYDYTQITGTSGQLLEGYSRTLVDEPGFQDLELWIFLGNFEGFYDQPANSLYVQMNSISHLNKADEIISGVTNGYNIENGFAENLGRPRNWGNLASLSGAGRARARQRLQRAATGTNVNGKTYSIITETSAIGTYYTLEQEYEYAVWAFDPPNTSGDFVLWSQSQSNCLQREEDDMVEPSTGCKVCPSRSSNTSCKNNGGDCDCYF